MPVARFFLMLDEALIIRAKHYSELCDIQAIPMCKPEYFETLKEKYGRILHGQFRPELPERPPENPITPVVQAGTEQARAMVFDLMSIIKRTT